MEYVIVDAATFGELERKVNAKLKKGFELVGGIAMYLGEDEEDTLCVQAMVKQSKKKK